MKKFLIALLVVLGVSCVALAEEATTSTTTKTVTLNAGILYSLKDHAISHTETLDLVKFFDVLSVEGGYGGDTDETDHKAILVASLDIKQLKLGNYVKLPILDLVEFRPGAYVGLGNITFHDLNEAKLDYGFSATVISYKF